MLPQTTKQQVLRSTLMAVSTCIQHLPTVYVFDTLILLQFCCLQVLYITMFTTQTTSFLTYKTQAKHTAHDSWYVRESLNSKRPSVSGTFKRTNK